MTENELKGIEMELEEAFLPDDEANTALRYLKPLIAEIRRLNAIIADMHVPEPIMVKRDGEYVEEGIAHPFGGPL